MAITDSYTATELLELAKNARYYTGIEIEGEEWVWLDAPKLWYQFEGANEGYTLPTAEFAELLQESGELPLIINNLLQGSV